MLSQERGRAPKVHLSETVMALHKYNRKHQLKVLTVLASDNTNKIITVIIVINQFVFSLVYLLRACFGFICMLLGLFSVMLIPGNSL